MRVLIIASSERELLGLSKFSSNGEAFLDQLLPCGCGEIIGAPVGVGLVQAALGTVSAILKWRPDHVLCFGTGGAVRENLDIGDLVCAEEVVQYTLDLQAFGLKRGESFGPRPGSVVGAIKPMLRVPLLEGVRQIEGNIGSADLFALRSWRDANPWLSEELHVVLTDMESYAMASACRQYCLPCCIGRVVSDTALGRRPKRYDRFLSETVAGILFSILESMKDRF